MDDKQIREELDRIWAKILEVDAHCIALQKIIVVRLEPTDANKAEALFDEIARFKKEIHSRLLTKLEDRSPSDAARLDRRDLRDLL